MIVRVRRDKASSNGLEALAKLDDDVLAEVVREGEATLSAQLTVSLAADQRAVAFAGIVLTAATALLGAVAVLARESPAEWSIVLLAALLAVGLFCSGAVALAVARPVRFCLPGNEPKNWLPDKWRLPAEGERSLKQARVEQATVLQSLIRQNRQTAASSARGMRAALGIAYLSVAIAGVAMIGIAIDRAAGAVESSGRGSG